MTLNVACDQFLLQMTDTKSLLVKWESVRWFSNLQPNQKKPIIVDLPEWRRCWRRNIKLRLPDLMMTLPRVRVQMTVLIAVVTMTVLQQFQQCWCQWCRVQRHYVSTLGVSLCSVSLLEVSFYVVLQILQLTLERLGIYRYLESLNGSFLTHAVSSTNKRGL